MTLSAGAAEAWTQFCLDAPGGPVERTKSNGHVRTSSLTLHDGQCSALIMATALLSFGKTDWVWVQSVFK